LIEIFGTDSPSASAVSRWRATWRDRKGKIQVSSFNQTIKFLEENSVDPLFYQFYADTGGDGSGGDVQEKFYVVFYKEEHEVFFKLHQGMA